MNHAAGRRLSFLSPSPAIPHLSNMFRFALPRPSQAGKGILGTGCTRSFEAPPMASAGEVQLADAALEDRIKALSDVRAHRARCSRPLPG